MDNEEKEKLDLNKEEKIEKKEVVEEKKEEPKKEPKKEPVEEKKEEFFETKDDKKTTIKKVVNIALWVILFLWMAVCLIDFFCTKAGNDPIFCIKKDTNKYSDGEVDICTGLGYKVINYQRESYKGREYGMFFLTKDRTSDNK